MRKDKKPDRIVTIAVPMTDLCHSGFTACLVNMVAYTLTAATYPVHTTFLSLGTSILPFSRMMLAKRSLELGATDILWIDSDMTFPADMLLRMLEHKDKIVAANCMARRPPFRCTAQTMEEIQMHTTPESTGLEEAMRVGFGVMWTPTRVFKEMELPWFDLEYMPEKYCWRGEDYVFCAKARAAGFRIFIDHDLSKEVEHLGMFGYTPLLRDVSAFEGANTQGDFS